ncbi:MAG: DUF2085 domain-containing protein [Anaerolineae bacterium]
MTKRRIPPHSRRQVASAILLVGLCLSAFLVLTPPNLLTKGDMVGYAVCHRIPSHSFFFAGRQLPLCARCTGSFVGALVGLFGQAVVLGRRRASDFPSIPMMAILIGFILLMGVDGANSYLGMRSDGFALYEPRQWLRLVTGALNGLALSGLTFPVLNLSLWENPPQRPAIRDWRDLGVMLLVEAGVVSLVLSGWPPLLYPLALLSAAGVVTLLTAVNAVLVMVVMGWENQYRRWREAVTPLFVGFAVTLIEIGLIDLVRYAATGTLEGLPGLS